VKVALMTAVAVIGVAGSASAGRALPPPACTSSQLALSLESQGESTMTRIDVVATNRGAACHIDADATVEITDDGLRAKIAGNPFRTTVGRHLSRGSTPLVRLDWTNWCAGGSSLRLVVSVGALSAGAYFRHIPVCLQPGRSSRLVRLT
jgi:hypothetical protein